MQDRKDNIKHKHIDIQPSQLEQLPIEIATQELALYLDKNDLANLVRASKSSYCMFQKPLKAAKLLHIVKEANYDNAEKIIDADPLLMFQHVSYKKADGTDETISPLKFAFKVLDTYMWKMFLEKIVGYKVILLKDFLSDLEAYKNQHILVSAQLYFVNADGKADIAKLKKPENIELFNRFLKEVHEQKDHINLEPLFAQCKTYVDQYNLWGQISNDAIAQAWLNVGRKQWEVLPCHMLKEFCRHSNSWNPKSKFDVDSDPCPTDIDICYKDLDESKVANRRLGVDFSLIRGWHTNYFYNKDQAYALARWWCWTYKAVEYDLEVLSRLHEVRTNDLKKLRSQLERSLANVSKMGL